MPYLRNDLKDILNPPLVELLTTIHEHVADAENDDHAMAEVGGLLNYAFNILALGVLMNIPASTRYAHLERIMGTFEAAKLEFWRRVVIPYEEEARRRHGDVFTDES